MNQPPAPPSEVIEQQKLKAQRLAASFEITFGQPGKRTDEQKAVIEHLSICAGDDGNSYRFHEAKDGIAMIAAGVHRDGAKSILRIIERQLSIAANDRKPAKAKTVTKR